MKKTVTAAVAVLVVFFLGFWAGRATSRRPHGGEVVQSKDGEARTGEKVLWDFEEPGQLAQWRLMDEMAASSVREHETRGDSSVRLDWPASQAALPGFKYEGRLEDLSKWGSLTFDAFNPGAKPIMINVKLKSTGHKKQATLNYVIPPKEEKTISIRLQTLANRIDLSDVMYFNIFVWQPREPGSLFVDGIRLEK